MIEEDLISAMPESQLQRPLNRQVAEPVELSTVVFGRGKEGEKGEGWMLAPARLAAALLAVLLAVLESVALGGQRVLLVPVVIEWLPHFSPARA